VHTLKEEIRIHYSLFCILRRHRRTADKMQHRRDRVSDKYVQSIRRNIFQVLGWANNDVLPNWCFEELLCTLESFPQGEKITRSMTGGSDGLLLLIVMVPPCKGGET
jgi:hypothetical protein